MKQYRRPFLRALSAVAANISAAWFILAFVTPNFAGVSIESIITLTRDILLGIVFLVLTTIIERILE